MLKAKMLIIGRGVLVNQELLKNLNLFASWYKFLNSQKIIVAVGRIASGKELILIWDGMIKFAATSLTTQSVIAAELLKESP